MIAASSTNRLHIDLETYGEIDLPTCGVYAYAAHPSFEILLLAYSIGDEPVRQIDVASGEIIPEELIQMLLDDKIVKVAHNATFERICLSSYLRGANRSKTKYLDPKNWACTAVRATTLGMPRSLDAVGQALKLSKENQKLSTGKLLINYFCKPCTPTRSNGYRTRNLPHHDQERWNLFKLYNRQDVVAERSVDQIESTYESMRVKEQELWELDQRINDNGVAVDMDLIDSIVDYMKDYTLKLIDRARELTGLDNPNSLNQVKAWMSKKGVPVDSLNKEDVAVLKETIQDADVLEYLQIRQELGKTSVAKFDAMKRAAIWDEETGTWRVHGMLMFYGAMRTGRWAGRIVQLQNLPQNKLPDLNEARELVKAGAWDWVDLMYQNNMEVVSQLVRTAFIPERGNTFIVADYSAIEARVIAWLADEKWKMDVFAKGGKIYEEAASRMFKIPVEQITHDSSERAKGKIAELAGGYGGGVAAYEGMGAAKYGWSKEEITKLVYDWRNANQAIVDYWGKSETAMRQAIESPGLLTKLEHGLAYRMQKDTLFNRLPSGRSLAYKEPATSAGRYKEKEISYLGENAKTGHYETIRSYGGKIVENQVQAIARDVLAWAMAELEKAGYKIRFHVHDEVVIEIPADAPESVDDHIKQIMALENVPWAKGLILKAESYRCEYYLKK